MRDPVPPAAAFVDFVAGHADRLYAAVRTLTDSDDDAMALVTDLFGAAAARWRTLRPPPGDPAGFEAAAEHVGRLFRRAAAAHGSPPRRYVAGVPIPVEALAGAAWARGRGVHRRRVLACAGALAVLAGIPLVRPDGRSEPANSPADTEEDPAAVPERVPLGIDLLPAPEQQAGLPWLASPLPARISLRESVGTLRERPIGRALAAIRAPGTPLLLLGPDGLTRRVPDPPGTGSLSTTTPWPAAGSAAPGSASATAWPVRLTTTSLSPDGTRVAQPTQDGLSVLDVNTGESRHYRSSERVRSVLWLGPEWVLLGRITSSVFLNLATGRIRRADVGGRNLLHPRAGGAQPGPSRPVSPEPARYRASLTLDRSGLRSGLRSAALPASYLSPRALPGSVELLPMDHRVPAPPVLRRYRDTPSGVRTLDAHLSGRLTGWVGLWRGVGFVTRTWALRDCTPMGRLPVGLGSPTLATAAVEPDSGTVGRLLVTVGGDADVPQLIGALSGGTALIRSRGEAGTLNLIAWRVATGRFHLVSVVDALAGISLADLDTW